MTRQEKNEQFLLSSFLYGGNASYIEDLYTRYKTDPEQHRPDLGELFRPARGQLRPTSRKNAEGPSWARTDWPQTANGELVSALDGNWGEIVVKTGAALGKKAAAEGAAAPTPVDVLQSTRDSIRAIMMIRAYRMRGHLHADLDPLKLKQDEPAPELDPGDLWLHRGRLRPQDLHRQRARARIRDHARDAGDPQAHLLLDRRRRVHAHQRS